MVREFGKVLDTHLTGRGRVCDSAAALTDLAIVTPFTGLRTADAPKRLLIGSFAHMRRWRPGVQALDARKGTGVAVAHAGSS
ncbi:MAG: hypothetical protein M0Z85_05040 [Gammaproteobacteria bacterium]|nr:hypothetical protein [Gammaproteobacteria bacterium]